ncbi:protein sidekick homolog [Montipora capricornis]|uniref:protein sidekick homolog n=1 Tax=Montipora capricornis TaxID=246305 RepID=UPI0035F21823
MWPLLCSEIISLSLIFLIQLSRGDKSSCIPEEYRGVRRDVWKGLNGGWYLKHLTQDKRFPDSPTLIEVLRTFTPPRNDDNYYGQQLRAFFIPPSNGNYTFHATCDSECVFYLSPDERPGNKKEVLRIDQSHRTSYNQWNKYLQQSSCVQQLERRKLYYIEALHSNYVDNDHVRIHIKYPGSSTVTPLGVEHLFLYSPGSSPQATCVLLRRCNITCSGGLGTRIRARNKLLDEACVKQTKEIYKEPPSLHVEAHNVTHSTAVIAWTPLLRNESGVILVSGYRVSLRSQDDRIHVKQVNISISSLLFEDLKTFTNYCVTVEPLTALAGTENEDCYHLMTDENTPSLPPLNITAKYKEPLSMIVEWKPLPREHRNGIIRGYRLTLKSISAIDQHEKPTELETKKWRREVTVLGPSVLWIEFSDVRAFTWYCVRMLAFTTKGDGDESTCVFLLTGESVPSSAPLNVTTTPLNSTSFLVAWQPVPLKNANGIVLGYRVLLENMADGSLLLNKTLQVNQTRVTLNRPKKVSRFCARVMAFTRKGQGKSSSCTEAWSWSKEEPPSLHVEAHNVTHSTAVIAWTPLLRNESGVILVSGYRVSLRSQDERIHVKQVNISISSLLFEDLKTFTNYCVTVEPLTALAGTENADCYHLMTDENTPSLPPLNITAKYKEPLSMVVEWKPVPRKQRNGIIRGYRLTLKSISAIDQYEKPTELETERWRREVTVLGPSVLWIEFSDVRAFTWYCVRVLAFTTKGDGDESTCVFLLTGESVPSSAPLNVTTTPLNSTSFLVAWQPVPLKNVNGIVLGYRVLLENMADGSLLLNKTLHINQTRVTLNRPKKVSRFCARVMAFTRKGQGKSSSCTEAWSWSKETVFPDMTAQGHSSPTGIKITWDAPRDQVIHKLSHYHVTYETISEAGRPVLNSSKFSVNVSANSRELPLDDLETYTGYKITVESVSSDGKVQNSKVFFAETCRCPNQLQANWIPSPPYVIRNTSTSKPGGILPELLSRMLQDSCGACLSHKTGNISYAINTTVSVTQPDNQLLLDFDFPVRSAVGRTIYKGIHAYVPLVTVPGVALMTRKKTPSAYARELEHSVFACWPIFAMSFALAILTGIIIWFVESETNYKQFYHFFHKGLPEGVWWSLITMTTVGYGDKYPKTIMGRFIAIVWFLTGIVLSSLLISSLTSSMSVRILDQRLDVTRGKKVGSLPQFPEYDILLRHISTAGGSKTYSSLEQLVDALGNNEVDGILVDLYTAHYRSDLFNASWMIVSKIIPYEFTTGVVITGNAAKLAQHFRDFIGNKSTVVTDILQKTTQENKEENTPRRREAKQIPLLDPKTEEYRMAITILFSALCFAVIVGLLYHLWYKKLQEQRYDLQDIRREERNHHMKAIQELRQIVVEFYQRFSLTYKQLRLKHCKELEQLKLIHDTECLIAVENTRGKISDHLLNGTWV